MQFIGGLPAAAREFLGLFREVVKRLAIEPTPPDPVAIGKSYYRCEMRPEEWRLLLHEDSKRVATRRLSPH